MSLLEKINNTLKGNLSFVIATGTFCLGASVDYLSTKAGLLSGCISEFNPIANFCLEELGLDAGLLLPKMVFGSITLSALRVVDQKHKHGETRRRAEYVLYPGALITGLAGYSWILIRHYYGLS